MPGMGTIESMLGEEPGQRNLGGGGVVPAGYVGEEVDDGLVGGEGVFGEAGQVAAEVTGGEGGGAVDGAGEEAFAERAERHEPDPQLDQGGQDLGFGFAPEQ